MLLLNALLASTNKNGSVWTNTAFVLASENQLNPRAKKKKVCQQQSAFTLNTKTRLNPLITQCSWNINPMKTFKKYSYKTLHVY